MSQYIWRCVAIVKSTQALTSRGRYHNWGATAKHVICPCVAPLGLGVVVMLYIWTNIYSPLLKMSNIDARWVGDGGVMGCTKFLSGKYRCEVSSDAPHFHTEVVSGYMHVVSEYLDFSYFAQ
ncbi:hypothetical protein J6590_085949 [Homalodisca vitripennis]|nr:hypothetical protein J6590_085949 [Homalodisca vitripennis]